ncbi:MAG: aminodeoxychorismate/anthranilate synthase component II [Granulosicoccus sp.]|nr:aminodeoxychorismate/anthranilate synthase component II [Granulosicoccus sp.]
MSTLAVIDNYDSFTWNLVQYAAELGCDVQVYRNDVIDCDELAALSPAAILVSPGPGRPDTAGISLPLLDRFAGQIPILGVCLGHQSIGQHFGASIVLARQIMHGKLSAIHHDNTGVFEGLPSPFTATRYHSLVIDAQTLPDTLAVTAWTQNADGGREEIMGVRHRDFLLEGVQFHPESISSEHGHELLGNFFTRAGLLPTIRHEHYENSAGT